MIFLADQTCTYSVLLRNTTGSHETHCGSTVQEIARGGILGTNLSHVRHTPRRPAIRMATSLWTFLMAITSISPLPHTMIHPQYNSPYAPLYLLPGYSADNYQRLRLASSARPGTAEASGYIRVSTHTGYIYPVWVGHHFLNRLNTAAIYHPCLIRE